LRRYKTQRSIAAFAIKQKMKSSACFVLSVLICTGRLAAHEDDKGSGHRSTVYVHEQSDENIDQQQEHEDAYGDHESNEDGHESYGSSHDDEDNGKYPSKDVEEGGESGVPKYPEEDESRIQNYGESVVPKYPEEDKPWIKNYGESVVPKYPEEDKPWIKNYGESVVPEYHEEDKPQIKNLYNKHGIPRPKARHPGMRPKAWWKSSRKSHPSGKAQPQPRPLHSDADADADGFTCEGKAPGYYADVNTNCEEYKICAAGHPVYTQRCGRGTIFNQRFLVCDHPFNYDCKNAYNDYQSNIDYGTFISE